MVAKCLGLGRPSFGKPERLLDLLGVTPGSVTPFALINDPEGRVTVGVDAALLTFAEVNCRSFFPSPDRCPGRCQTGIPGPSSR
jgi:hypothetical protein